MAGWREGCIEEISLGDPFARFVRSFVGLAMGVYGTGSRWKWDEWLRW